MRKRLGQFGPLSLHPHDRQAGISEAIRRRIIRGELRPGDRLPSRQDLAVQFKAALRTSQKALSRLEQDGFIVSLGRSGTFVASKPPHVYRIGIVLPEAPRADALGRWFYSTILHVANQQAWLGPRQIEVYTGVRGLHEEEPDLSRLAEDLISDRLAGVLILDGSTLRNPPLAQLLVRHDVRVVGTVAEAILPNMLCLRLSNATFMKHAMARLAREGCKRPAVLSGFQGAHQFWREAQSAAAEHGITLANLKLEGSTEDPKTVRSSMHLLPKLKQSELPDALIITDDNLVPDATGALAESGSEFTRRLKIVAHANFPLATNCYLPAARLGFDAAEVIASAFKLIDGWRAGGRQSVADLAIPPRFQDELKTPASAPVPAWPA